MKKKREELAAVAEGQKAVLGGIVERESHRPDCP